MRVNHVAMPPCDRTLDLIFSFLLEKKGATDRELQLATRPVCRLLQTRRMRGAELVTLEVCRRGLGWAMRLAAETHRRYGPRKETPPVMPGPGLFKLFEKCENQLLTEMRRREELRNRSASSGALEPSP